MDLTLNNSIDNGLETAVYLSLFTDARSLDDDDPPAKRGYWGDALTERPLGSRLWLLSRAKVTSETLSLIETYSRESLEWLLLDNIAIEINVSAAVNPIDNDMILINIGIVKPNGTTEVLEYGLNWREQGGV